jgi:DNA repair protein RadC
VTDKISKLYRVQDLPAKMQPRELFDRLGPENVTEEVLLALIIRTGLPGQNVLELARSILHHYGSLHAMLKNPGDLKNFPGMGPVKIQMVQAALELGRRIQHEASEETIRIDTPEDAVKVLRPLAHGLQIEKFWILILDARNQLKKPPQEITKGIANASLVHPREVFEAAIKGMANAVILAHNHPSGDPSPSPEDLRITRELVAAGKIMDIQVLDHVIVGRPGSRVPEGWCSIRESGLVAFQE